MASHINFHNGLLIVGSSHALAGINENAWGEAVNCSMHSQDLYYDYLCIKRIFEEDECSFHGISKCLLVMGYYMPYQDLSLSKRARSEMISRTYYPIFRDAHNWDEPVAYNHWQNIGAIFDEDKFEIENEAVDISKRYPFYSDECMKRKPLFDFAGRNWAELSEQERIDFGRTRAEVHNSIMSHAESFNENVEILRNLSDLLKEKWVMLSVVVTPFSNEYEKFVAKEQKQAFYKMMEITDIDNVINFNDSMYKGIFDDSDFMDMDHLNQTGCYKYSHLLKEILDNI